MYFFSVLKGKFYGELFLLDEVRWLPVIFYLVQVYLNK